MKKRPHIITAGRDDNRVFHVIARCNNCGTAHMVSPSALGFESWIDDKGNIQDMMPELTADERELLVSGTCGKCFDAMFAGD